MKASDARFIFCGTVRLPFLLEEVHHFPQFHFVLFFIFQALDTPLIGIHDFIRDLIMEDTYIWDIDIDDIFGSPVSQMQKNEAVLIGNMNSEVSLQRKEGLFYFNIYFFRVVIFIIEIGRMLNAEMLLINMLLRFQMSSVHYFYYYINLSSGN